MDSGLPGRAGLHAVLHVTEEFKVESVHVTILCLPMVDTFVGDWKKKYVIATQEDVQVWPLTIFLIAIIIFYN